MAITNYHLADVIAQYLIGAFEDIVIDVHGFMKQFNIIVEVDDEMEDPIVVDYEILERWLKEGTAENGDG